MSKPLSIAILNVIFKVISFFIPVKNRVIFLGTPRNAKLMENGQLVYDALNCDKKIIIRPMPHGISDIMHVSYYIMSSRVLVIDDHYRYFAYIPLKNNQKLIQMWHGPGAFKKVALDLPNYNIREEYTHRQYDSFITSAPSISKYIESGFHISSDKIMHLGYPRSDLLINNKEELIEEFHNQFPILKDKDIIVYLPTYRRYGEDVLDYDYEIDWKQFDEFLKENNVFCLVKRHPLQITNDLNIVPKNCENIIDVGEFSYFPLIVVSKLLITDYSSVFFDYLLLNKPMIFYCPDSEEYLEKNGFYLNFPEDLPGDYCENFEDLLDCISNPNEQIDYAKFKERYMKACDGNSTKKVVDLIESYLIS